ncbi:uncharacterized protein LOC112600891 [Melanaphis sacchari]|uniref:uncharacterized protein LOC112600891 n=1 Tax=Melanaphis sacchari TaxID=742174 RepID=UPI000DC15726|nr:uncharacterized protein LOC112600891 [Melanaphis sacchari]
MAWLFQQGLSYRGKDEAAYNLEDRSVNHGNFLELVWLIKDYDVVLNEHIQNSIHLSNKRKEKELCNIKNGNQVHGHGRGSLVTFLSKTFVNKLILIIGQIIQNKLINDIKQAKLFSIMVDSTQDVSVLDQLAICVRYVLNNEVHEKLLKLIIVYDSSGKGLYDLISSEFHKLTLDISKIVGCSFDGAANMKGTYNGLQSHLKNKNPLCVYTHCVGHVLNLVMVDSSEYCVNAEFLFGLVQQSSTFLLDSYKRMKVWSELTKKTHTSNDKLRRLNLIGATQIISNHSTFDSKTKFTARTLLQNWSKFDVIMTAAIYLDIFSISSPISKFLQSPSLNYLTAFNMINNLHKEIRSRRDNADSIFINLYTKVEYQKKKKMSGEKATDERPNMSQIDRFKIETFNYIHDICVNSLDKRFISNTKLLSDCVCLDPKNFNSIKNEVPANALIELSILTTIDRNTLAYELQQFALQFNSITKTFEATFTHLTEDSQFPIYEHELDLDEDQASVIDSSNNCKTCNNCLRCAFNVLYNIVQQSGCFNNIYYAYKFVLTLPCTQVTCERTFSKLKNIKTKLRSTISQDTMEALLLMNIERNVEIDKESVIDCIAKSSNELSKLLLN